MSIPELRAWFEQYGKALVLAKFAQNLPAAKAAYEIGLNSLEQELDLELRRVKQLRLQAAWYLALYETGQAAAAHQLYAELRSTLAAPETRSGLQYGPVVAFCELHIRTHADAQGIEAMPAADALRLIKAVPPDMRGPNYWSSVAHWGFKLGDSELLDEAFSHFVGNRPAEMSEWMHARLLVMRGLLRGEVDQQHLANMLLLTELPRQLADMNRELWPALKAQGCITAEIEQLRLAKQAELSAGPLRPPQAGG